MNTSIKFIVPFLLAVPFIQYGKLAQPGTEQVQSTTITAGDSLRGKDTVAIETTLGTITVVLYNETPLHRDNFIKLVNSHFYDSILFHRVINGFMIQAGDPQSKQAKPNAVYGSGGPGYTIPAEFNTNLVHKRGTLAAARMGDQMNPRKESSGSQFYICHTATPFLDGQYTVFGETVAGFDVLDKIATSQTLPGDRPVKDIRIISMKQIGKAVANKKAEPAPAKGTGKSKSKKSTTPKSKTK